MHRFFMLFAVDKPVFYNHKTLEIRWKRNHAETSSAHSIYHHMDILVFTQGTSNTSLPECYLIQRLKKTEHHVPPNSLPLLLNMEANIDP